MNSEFRMKNYELFHVKHSPTKLQVSPGQVFDCAVLSAHGSESEYVREDEETVSASRPRVPVPNARLNLRRRPQNLFCACFSCTNRDRAGLTSCSGSSGPDLNERVGMAERFPLTESASLPSPSHPNQAEDFSGTSSRRGFTFTLPLHPPDPAPGYRGLRRRVRGRLPPRRLRVPYRGRWPWP